MAATPDISNKNLEDSVKQLDSFEERYYMLCKLLYKELLKTRATSEKITVDTFMENFKIPPKSQEDFVIEVKEDSFQSLQRVHYVLKNLLPSNHLVDIHQTINTQTKWSLEAEYVTYGSSMADPHQNYDVEEPNIIDIDDFIILLNFIDTKAKLVEIQTKIENYQDEYRIVIDKAEEVYPLNYVKYISQVISASDVIDEEYWKEPESIYLSKYVQDLVKKLEEAKTISADNNFTKSGGNAKLAVNKDRFLKDRFLGAGGFGQVFKVENQRDLRTLLKKIWLRGSPKEECMNYNEQIATSELPFPLAVKYITDLGAATEEIKLCNAVRKLIDDTAKNDSFKEIFNKLNYHKIEPTPENICSYYTPLLPNHLYIKIKDRGYVKKKLVLSAFRDNGDLHGKTLNSEEVSKCYRSCLMLLYIFHKKGYYHFDIKPMNIFYANNSIYNLADYGLIGSAFVGAGTPIYMSPYVKSPYNYWKQHPFFAKNSELQKIVGGTYEKGNLNAKHDLFALGLSMYEISMPKDIVSRLVGVNIDSPLNTVDDAIKALQVGQEVPQKQQKEPDNARRKQAEAAQKEEARKQAEGEQKLLNELAKKRELLERKKQEIEKEEKKIEEERIQQAERLKQLQELKKQQEEEKRLRSEEDRKKAQIQAVLNEIERKKYENELRELEEQQEALRIKNKALVKDILQHALENKDESEHKKFEGFLQDREIDRKTFKALDSSCQLLPSGLENQYEFMLSFFSIVAQLLKDDKEYPVEKLKTDFADIFQYTDKEKNDHFLAAIVNEICIFMNLYQTYLKLDEQQQLLWKANTQIKKVNVLASKVETFFGLKTSFTRNENLHYPIIRFTKEKYVRTLRNFKMGLNLFAKKIIAQLKSEALPTRSPDANTLTTEKTDAWLRDMYVTVKELSDVEIQNDVEKNVFTAEYYTAFIQNYNNIIFQNDKKLRIILQKIQDNADAHFEDKTIQEIIYKPNNVLIYAIYIKTYKLIISDYLRIYMLNALLLKCDSIKECNRVLDKGHVRSQQTTIEHMVDAIVSIETTRIHFIKLLNSIPDYIVVNISSYFPASIKDIESLVRQFNNPLVLKYASIAEKILSYLDSNAIDSKHDIVCYEAEQLRKDQITMSDVVDYCAIIFNIFIENLENIQFDWSKIEPNIQYCRSPDAEWLDDLKDFLNWLRFGGILTKPEHQNELMDLFSQEANGIDGFIRNLNQKNIALPKKITLPSLLEPGNKTYINLVNFYENISGAVRVYVKFRDFDLGEGRIDPAPRDITKSTKNWKYPVDKISVSGQANIRIFANKSYLDYGPFYQVIPPKQTNKQVAEDYLQVNDMSEILCNKPVNLVLMTYGYSGSGKSYTLFGNVAPDTEDVKSLSLEDLSKREKKQQEAEGIVFKFIENIYKQGASVQLKSVHLLYGVLKVDRKKTLFQDELKALAFMDNAKNPDAKYSDQLKSINDLLRNKNIKEAKQAIKDLLFTVIEKQNIQNFYDLVSRAINQYLTKQNDERLKKTLDYEASMYNQTNLTVNDMPLYDFILKNKNNPMYCKRLIFHAIFANKSKDKEPLYIKSTPNNPNSSRGFLFFTFEIQRPDNNGEKSRLVVIDMAGNEDPYDIMFKTIPTFRLPYKKEYTFLRNVNVTQNDIVFKSLEDNIMVMLKEVFDIVTSTVYYMSVSTDPEKLALRLLGYALIAGKDKKGRNDVVQNFADIKKVNSSSNTFFAVFRNLLTASDRYDNKGLEASDFAKFFPSKPFSFLKSLLKHKNFAQVVNALNFSMYDFSFKFTQLLSTFTNVSLRYNGVKYNDKVVMLFNNELNRLGINKMKSTDNMKDLMSNLYDVTIDHIKKKLGLSDDAQQPFLECIIAKEDQQPDKNEAAKPEQKKPIRPKRVGGGGYKAEPVNINIKSNELLMQGFALYVLGTDSRLSEFPSRKMFKDLDIQEHGIYDIIDQLNGISDVESNKRLILFGIDKISQLMDVLYFDYFKAKTLNIKAMKNNNPMELLRSWDVDLEKTPQDPDDPIKSYLKDLIQKLSYMKYMLQMILTSSIFSETFQVSSMFEKNIDKFPMFSRLQFQSASKYSLADKKEIEIDNKLYKVDPKSLEKARNIEGLNAVFGQQRVAVVKVEDLDEADPDKWYTTIETNVEYYQNIINEGFYINQVNHELVSYLKARLNKYDVNVVTDNPSEEGLVFTTDDLQKLVADGYDANVHAFGRKDVTDNKYACTRIFNALDTIIGIKNPKQNNKFFMIANIRPVLQKFRQGAINTLDLVNDLKST